MKKLIIIVMAVVFSNCTSEYSPKNGDIIFQTSMSSQSKALQIVTKSKFSHMGIVYILSGDVYVYEAVQPVKLTPLKEWIASGKEQKYAVKRLKNYSNYLNEATMKKMIAAGEKYKGKNYDIYFEWSDDNIYCSELVWKMYKEVVGLEIGNLQQMKAFDLSHPEVQKKLTERFGNRLPGNETVITPVSMYNSNQLELVYSNY